MEVVIGAVGRLKKGPLLELIDEYKKRLSYTLRWYEVEAKASLEGDLLATEESRLLEGGIPKGSYVIVLDEKGQETTSVGFSQWMEKWQAMGKSSLVFLIGGAGGHSDVLLKKADFCLSLGSLTWPHKIVRLLLIEQLYRAQQIMKGHPYHRE